MLIYLGIQAVLFALIVAMVITTVLLKPEKAKYSIRYWQIPSTIVVLDVTGHGIPAALAASRLHSDLTIVKAERPAAGLTDILRTLDSLQHGPPDDDTVLLNVSTVVQ